MSGGNIKITSTGKFKLIQWFLDCLFPKECLVCKQEGEFWCQSCQSEVLISYPNNCFSCQKLNCSEGLCSDCQLRFAFDGVIIASDYEEEVMSNLIRTYKYKFIKSLAYELSLILRKKLEEFLQKPHPEFLIEEHFFSAVIIGMPLSSRRQRWREFNQANLLATHIADYCNLEYRNDFLYREHRKPQAKLTSTERLHNLANSFFVKGSVPRLVIIVDDVITTGATLHESAKVLKQAGAQEVWGLILAKG